MGEGNGHVNVGAGRGGDPRGDDPAAAEPGPPPESRLSAFVEAWLRPGPAAVVALVVVATAYAGWRTATWRADDGAVVSCPSFSANPAVWHWLMDAGPSTDLRPEVNAPQPSWAAAVRETNGLIDCAGLEGRLSVQVTEMLGPPTDRPGTEGSEVDGLRADERAWTVSRDAPAAPDTIETTGVVLRFADGGAGRVVAVRRFHRLRAI